MQLAQVDVLLPVYNAETFLAESLDSVLSQTDVELKVILVDDGSTDESIKIASDYAKQDDRIHVIRRRNGGIVDALNEGLSHCRSEFIARHDADDIAHPGRLKAQADFLRQNPDFCAVGAVAAHINEMGSPLGTFASSDHLDDPDFTRAPVREPYILHPLLMMRRAAIENVGGYRHVVNAEDADLFWRLNETGRLGHIPKVLADYRIHGASIMSASIQAGRIAAVHSELAGISAARRAAGKMDLDFPSTRDPALFGADTLEAMVESVAASLDSEEAAFLKVAASAKLMCLAQFRPFELELSDCQFISRQHQRRTNNISAQNWRELQRLIAETMLRLSKRGRLREAIALSTNTRLAGATTLVLEKIFDRTVGRLRAKPHQLVAAGAI